MFEIQNKEQEIEMAKKRMSATERQANRVPSLESQVKSLKVGKRKEDTEIHKIIRLGKQLDEK
jgi:hypothetical protein